FRTAAHVGPVLAEALLVLLREVDDRLGRPAALDVVDVGAGGGELLTELLRLAAPDLAARLRPVGIDLLARPDGLDDRIRWVRGEAPAALPSGVRGLLIAHELLDELPVEVVAVDSSGALRTVLVDDDGTETLGDEPDERVRSWVATWWGGLRPGDRAECGLARDEAWSACVRAVAAGTALAVDYGHVREERESGRYAAGTVAGYRDGRSASAVPDGRANLTAHVAVDAAAAAAEGLPGTAYPPVRQREALLALGVSAALPDVAIARTDPAAYADALARASQASELLDPAGLGAFWWLRHDV
ncbi:MAG: SAM-dependent methyltransferase, partial [Candidatus Nanopelagicales bacterium]